MRTNLDASQNNARQYWFADGLAELNGGALALLLAVYFALVQLFPDSPLVTILLFLGLFIIAYGIRLAMQQIRTRTTYPRTGYIVPKSGWEDRRMLIITIVFTLALLGLMLDFILFRHWAIEPISVFGGLILTFIFSMIGSETKLIRFIYLAIFCLLLGLVLAFSGLGDFWGVAVLSLITSLILFAYGAITRITYLRHTSQTLENHDEH